jgi:hypothetical protein
VGIATASGFSAAGEPTLAAILRDARAAGLAFFTDFTVFLVLVFLPGMAEEKLRRVHRPASKLARNNIFAPLDVR